MIGRRAVHAVVASVMLVATGSLAQSPWSEVILPSVNTSIDQISFVDSVHGCLCATVGGELFFTTDNGASWTAGTIPTTEFIRGCRVVSDGVVWAWTQIGSTIGRVALFHSSDRGQTWARRDLPDTLLARGFAFRSDSVIWLAGRTHLWVSEDQGATWKRRGAFNAGGYMMYANVECFDDSVAYLSGQAVVFPPQRTTDGGRTWATYFIGPEIGGYFDACGPLIFADDSVCTFVYHYMSEATTQRYAGLILSWNRLRDTLHLRLNPYESSSSAGLAINRQSVWLWGGSPGNVLRRTTDGGTTWTNDTFDATIQNALYDRRGHRFVLAGGRLFRLRESPLAPTAGAFPLAAGNLWHYKITYFNANGPSTVTYASMRVLGDTVMPGGTHFWVLDRPDPFGGRYVRVDSCVVHYWDANPPGTERHFITLTSPVGVKDSIAWDGYFTSIAGSVTTDTLFGQQTVLRSFSLGGIVFGRVTFADGLGYAVCEFNGDTGSPIFTYELIGCRIDGTVYGIVDAVQEATTPARSFELGQNYPNPFNPSTTIRYGLLHRSHVSLTVFNTLGQQISILQNGEQAAGYHEVRFDASDLPSGVYLYRLRSGEFTETKKLVLVR